jgi:hypothetical protein
MPGAILAYLYQQQAKKEGTQMAASKSTSKGRSAITGQYVTKEQVRRSPKTTVTEKPKGKK